MQLTTGTLTACSGGEHLTLPVTVNGVTRNLEFQRNEFTDAKPEGFEELQKALIQRLRSAVMEAGATTPVQIRNAVSNKTFHL